MTILASFGIPTQIKNIIKLKNRPANKYRLVFKKSPELSVKKFCPPYAQLLQTEELGLIENSPRTRRIQLPLGKAIPV